MHNGLEMNKDLPSSPRMNLTKMSSFCIENSLQCSVDQWLKITGCGDSAVAKLPKLETGCDSKHVARGYGSEQKWRALRERGVDLISTYVEQFLHLLMYVWRNLQVSNPGQ